MDTSANIVTTMGIISDEVYKSIYFANRPINEIEPLKANGTTYKVLEHTPATDGDFNALLLQDTTTGNYVIAFRGTQEKKGKKGTGYFFTASPSPDGKPLTTLLPCFNVD